MVSGANFPPVRPWSDSSLATYIILSYDKYSPAHNFLGNSLEKSSHTRTIRAKVIGPEKHIRPY